MDHVRPIEPARGRPPVAPVPRVRRVRRDDDRPAEEREQPSGDGRRPPSGDGPGRLDVRA